MQADIERVLIPADQIKARVAAMARQVLEDMGDHAEELTIVPILTGAMILTADLIREMPRRLKINLMTVSSYPGSALRSQGANLVAKQLGDVAGRHVLLVDDILDSGGTLKLVTAILRELGAASVRSLVLLRKNLPTPPQAEADYVGFPIPDEFVVGYGLDYDNVYRNLPDICTLKEAIYAGR
jgi:hypoxanthine phosphoribosyltransferase